MVFPSIPKNVPHHQTDGIKHLAKYEFAAKMRNLQISLKKSPYFYGMRPTDLNGRAFVPPDVLGGSFIRCIAVSDHILILVSPVQGLNFASFWRFWAMAASVN